TTLTINQNPPPIAFLQIAPNGVLVNHGTINNLGSILGTGIIQSSLYAIANTGSIQPFVQIPDTTLSFDYAPNFPVLVENGITLTINSGTRLTINDNTLSPPATFLQIASGGTIVNSGILYNLGRLVNSGTIYDNCGGVFDNSTGILIGAGPLNACHQITIGSPSNSSPVWGVDSVSVSGTASGNIGSETVTVEWGDGNSTKNIPISGGTWGPVSYVYGIFAIITNPNVIVAKQVDSSGNALVANSTGLINVQRHPTALVFRTVQDSV